MAFVPAHVMASTLFLLLHVVVAMTIDDLQLHIEEHEISHEGEAIGIFWVDGKICLMIRIKRFVLLDYMARCGIKTNV